MFSENFKETIKQVYKGQLINRTILIIIAVTNLVGGGLLTYVIGLSNFSQQIIPTVEAMEKRIAILESNYTDIINRNESLMRKVDTTNGGIELLIQYLRK